MAEDQTLPRKRLKGLIGALDDDTDFVIKLDNYSWWVHAEILSKASKFFKSAVEGPWTESQQQCVEMHDATPFTVARMIQFLYTGEYHHEHDIKPFDLSLHRLLKLQKCELICTQDLENSTRSDIRPFLLDLDMYLLADQYDISTLKKYALNRFRLDATSSFALSKIMTNDKIRSLADIQPEFKEAIANKFAKHYKTMRRLATFDNEAKGNFEKMRDWLGSDLEFNLVVMDILSGHKKT